MQQFLAILAFLVIFVIVFRALSVIITIFEHERGLKYHKGRFVKILGPGRYRIFTPVTTVSRIDVRTRFVSIAGQEVLSSDGITLKVSLAAQYDIADPHVAVNKVENYQQAFYLLLQLALREIIGQAKIDEVLEKRNVFSAMLKELVSQKVEELGLKLLAVDVKDIMFPGDLKKIFSQVVKAQKEGIAAIEKARSETAALRNLANAAKMMEDNPALMQVRLLQQLGESSGNTLVLGVPHPTTPIPHRSKDIGKSKIQGPGNFDLPEDIR
ncbi:MAG: slipin family protein [Armatimonadetes bacterium]|nr:slipin family protein [Armatimonadota bacterium]